MNEPIQTTAPRRNSRRGQRQTPKGSTRVVAYRNALGLGQNIAIRILDLSESGVRLILSENLLPGTEFEITLGSVARKPVRLLANVVWCVPTTEGQFAVGAQFAKPLNYATLQELSRV